LNQQAVGQPLTVIQSFLFKLSSKPTNTTKYEEELDISTAPEALELSNVLAHLASSGALLTQATQSVRSCAGSLVDGCKHKRHSLVHCLDSDFQLLEMRCSRGMYPADVRVGCKHQIAVDLDHEDKVAGIFHIARGTNRELIRF
jgi:hypothetical protein